VNRIVLLGVAATAFACVNSKPTPDVKDAGPTPTPSTTASAELWVDGGCHVVELTCPGGCDHFDIKLRAVRESTQIFCREEKPCSRTAEVGKCAAYRYIHFEDKYASETIYYTADGKPVARQNRAEGAPVYCNGRAKGATYGTLPSCPHEITEDLVPNSPTPRLGARPDAGFDAGRGARDAAR
jgi:hypothetical protein